MNPIRLISDLLARLSDFIGRRQNPMCAHPGYASLTKAIAERRRKHLPVRDLLGQRRELVHRALAGRAR